MVTSGRGGAVGCPPYQQSSVGVVEGILTLSTWMGGGRSFVTHGLNKGIVYENSAWFGVFIFPQNEGKDLSMAKTVVFRTDLRNLRRF